MRCVNRGQSRRHARVACPFDALPMARARNQSAPFSGVQLISASFRPRVSRLTGRLGCYTGRKLRGRHYSSACSCCCWRAGIRIMSLAPPPRDVGPTWRAREHQTRLECTRASESLLLGLSQVSARQFKGSRRRRVGSPWPSPVRPLGASSVICNGSRRAYLHRLAALPQCQSKAAH